MRTHRITLLVIWGVATTASMVGMVRYQLSAAAPLHSAPRRWPEQAAISCDAQRFNLVMTLHPRCPCSQASLHELEVLLSRVGSRVQTHILFVIPIGAPPDWVNGPLWEQTNQMANVNVHIDDEGRISSAFGAATSGYTLLYGPGGQLLFSGGITNGRGSEGDNPGLEAVLTLIRGRPMQTLTAPVFGCRLGIGETLSRSRF